MAEVSSDFYIDYSKLDNYERKVIQRRNDQSMVVTGSAGSGKSLIALHKAQQLSSQGKDYMIVVFTKTLRKYFSDGLKELNLGNVMHYHKWRYHKQHTEYLIVDECQDFTSDEIDEFIESSNHLFLFGDTAQSIMKFPDRTPQGVEKSALKLQVPLNELYYNYRLTKECAALADEVCEKKGQDLADSCVRSGEKPYAVSISDYDAQLDRIMEIIDNRNMDSVGILLPFNTIEKATKARVPHLCVEYVKDYLIRKGKTCEFKYDDQDTEMDLDFHTDSPKIMTYWCAKGLQFKNVFIPGCNYPCKLTNQRSALYVAMTRCSERLFLLYKDSLPSFFPNPNSSDLYNVL